MKYSVADLGVAIAVGLLASGIVGVAFVLGARREIRERWQDFVSA